MEITNHERTWFCVFILWCRKYGKDHETEDFNQIKTIPEEEYQELQSQALFYILASGKCPSCWGNFDSAPKMCKSASVVPIQIMCPHCQFPYKVTPLKKIADWVEEEAS